MSHIKISGVSQESYYARTKSALEAILGSPIKKSSIVRRFLSLQLHGGSGPGKNEHNLECFFRPTLPLKQSVPESQLSFASKEVVMYNSKTSKIDNHFDSGSSANPTDLYLFAKGKRSSGLIIFSGMPGYGVFSNMENFLHELGSTSIGKIKILMVGYQHIRSLDESVYNINKIELEERSAKMEVITSGEYNIVIIDDIERPHNLILAILATLSGSLVLCGQYADEAEEAIINFKKACDQLPEKMRLFVMDELISLDSPRFIHHG